VGIEATGLIPSALDGWLLAASAWLVPTPKKTPKVSDSVTASTKNIRNIERNM
jgi:hypothetical protein